MIGRAYLYGLMAGGQRGVERVVATDINPRAVACARDNAHRLGVADRLIVRGQVHGGVAQGFGQAVLERTAYDPESGQLLSASFMDYALPRAEDLPPILTASRPVPAKTNPVGAKGCGEAGCAGSLPAVMNAVVDALAEFGVTHIDMPATPERVLMAVERMRAV